MLENLHALATTVLVKGHETPWPSDETPTFSIVFSDVVFAIVPAAGLVLLSLLVAAFAAKESHGQRRTSTLLSLVSILVLDVASILLYVLLPWDSPFRSPYGLAAYATRAGALLALALLYWRLPAQTFRLVGLYVLLSSLFDSVRLHTLWYLTSHAAGLPERRLAIVQSLIVGVGALFIIYEASVSRRLMRKDNSVEVNEQQSSTLGRLLFGWILPLLTFGRATSITEKDIKHVDYHPYAVHWEENAIVPPRQARKFYLRVLTQYGFALVLSLLSAAATLVQPFIIGTIVSFMESGGSLEKGIWLVIAMFANQCTVAICNAHKSHLISQVNYRVRSYLVQKVFQRALAPSAQVGSTESISSKAMVHASVDVRTVLQGPSVIINCIGNNIIVVVASYMLYKQIGIAFMGPLILAILGTAVPILLGPYVAKAQHAALKATEMRLQAMRQVTADVRNVRMGGLQGLTEAQVTDFRKLEVEREAKMRRILVVVVVIALCLESLCVLAAFTIYAFSSSSMLDYSRLFTSLTILRIMISPLLEALQQIPSMISGVVSWKRVNSFVNSKPDPAFFANRQSKFGQSGEILSCYRDNPDIGYVLKFDNACIGWTNETTLLRDLSATLCPGDIVVVTGRSASGKSTLLKCALGEGQVHSGSVDLQTADLAFCDQTPWFIPDISLRDNIILGKSFDQSLYANVIKCCCLAEDFARQESGDQTTIDSKGTSLSGGQRARLSLARALYQEAELFLLDDIFTGLDKTTMREVADNVFGQDGYLSKRPHIAVLFSSTIVPTVVANHAKARVLLLEEGNARVVDSLQLSSAPGLGQASIDQTEDEEPTDKSEETPKSSTKRTDDEVDVPERASGEYITYIHSLGAWPILLLAVVCMGAYAVIDKAATFWLTRWSNAYSNGGSVNTSFYIGIYSLFAGGNMLILLIVVLLFFLIMIPASSLKIHGRMLATFLQSPASVVEATRSQILNRFTQDIGIIDEELPMALINLQLGIAMIASSIIVVGIGAPYSLFLVVMAMPPLYLLQKHYLATSTRLRVLQMGAQAPVLGALGSSLDGRLTLRAFNLNNRMMADMTARVHRAARPGYLFNGLQTWLSLTLDGGNIVIITVVSAMLVTLKQQSGVGWGALALLNALNLAFSIKHIMYSWTNWEMSMGAMTRIMSYTANTPVESVNGSPAELSSTWPSRGEISLKGLTLAYTEKEIVRDLSLHVPAGTKIAVLGRTGSGKTSIMQSFFGLLRTVRGSLEVDGVKLSSVEPSQLRSRLVGNPQQTFSNGIATLRRNMDPSMERSDEEIRAAIEKVTPSKVFHHEIMSKLDSKWEECTFSAGWQRQIGLARMMLRKSNVYILDEPTSGMDEADHDAIMGCLFESLTDKTVMVITHTVKGIEKFDHVAVLADGKLVESAPPEQLLQDTTSRLYKYVHGHGEASPTRSQ